MDAQQQLFGLMAVAEEHQKAVKVAIDALNAELAGLAKERAALTQATASVAGVAGDVRKAAADIAPTLQKAAGEAVGGAVRTSLAGASETAAKALETASRPILGNLAGVARAAGEAEDSIRNASQWFAWKAVGVAAGGVHMVGLLAWSGIWWQRHQIEGLAEQRNALQGEVASLQAQAEEWSKRAGRAKLERCGDKGRLCVRVDTRMVYGENNDYYVLKGY